MKPFCRHHLMPEKAIDLRFQGFVIVDCVRLAVGGARN